MERKFFTYKMLQIGKKISLLVNFSKDGKQTIGQLTPTRPYIFLNEDKSFPYLIFPEQTLNFTTRITKTEEEDDINDMKEVGDQISGIIGIFGQVLSGVLSFTMVFGGGGAIAAKMMRLFEVINR